MSRNGLSNTSCNGLSANVVIDSLYTPIQRTQQIAIVSEISARINEWHTTNAAGINALDWWLRVALLAQDNPDAFWIYHALQSGDLSALTQTYQEQANHRHLSRQDIHQRHTRALNAMQDHFPDLKDTITKLHHLFRPSRGKQRANFEGPS